MISKADTHSRSVITPQGQAARISRTGDTTGPESADSISLFSDRKGDFSPTVSIGQSAAGPCQTPLTSAEGEVRHSHWAVLVRRVCFVGRFIYWTCRHGSTQHAGWVCNFEGLYW